MNREIVVSFRSSPATWPAGGDDDECVAWEGYPTLPDFASVLSSPHGAWAVVSTGTACSSFEQPCSG